MRMLLVAGAFAVVAWPGAPSHAQSYPVKPVRYVVAFAAGDSPDIVARLVADRLSRLWDQQMVVENRVGAGGTIAAAAVANAPPDGYTLFHCNIASSAIAVAMYQKLPYDPLRDFAMVSRIATTANALIVHPSLPTRSVAEFIGYAKAHPGKISYGSPGVGTSPHLSMELFKSIAGINVVHIAYKGAMPALADLTRTLQAPDVQQRLTDLVIDVAPTSRDEFTAFIRSEIARWGQVVKDAGISPQ